jgi:23S rRNA (adenine2503-C2)-methyltransferase
LVKIKKIKIGDYILPTMVINLSKETIISIPTQIGCIIDCSFCISSTKKFVRNLNSKEMVELFKESKKLAKNKKIMLSFTGEGEPFLNIKEINKVIKELEVNIEITKFRICTSGIKPNQLSKIINSTKPINLQISLHSPFTEKRKKIIEKSKSVEEVISAVHKYQDYYDEIAFNYVLINEFNDQLEDLNQLKKIINKNWLIKLNPLLSEKGAVEEVKNKDLFYNELKKEGYKVKNYSKIGSEISNKFYDQLTYEYSKAIIIN